jgi:hypothetical protein
VANKDVKVPYMMVSSAKGQNGKLMADLKGKMLKVTGPKAADAARLSGKDARLVGIVKGETIDPSLVIAKRVHPAQTSARHSPAGTHQPASTQSAPAPTKHVS